MTPELKSACEVIFQEHKLSSQIRWDKRAFRGQLSIGLSELAKKTLVEKKIILTNKSKKIITLLNPVVASASSFEEAEYMIENKIPVSAPVNPIRPAPSANGRKEEPVYISAKVSDIKPPSKKLSRSLAPIVVATSTPAARVPTVKWYLKPVFCYFIWPLCGLAVGALLSFLLDYAFSELFLHTK